MSYLFYRIRRKNVNTFFFFVFIHNLLFLFFSVFITLIHHNHLPPANSNHPPLHPSMSPPYHAIHNYTSFFRLNINWLCLNFIFCLILTFHRTDVWYENNIFFLFYHHHHIIIACVASHVRGILCHSSYLFFLFLGYPSAYLPIWFCNIF